MSILHIVNKSPFSHNTLSSCLSVCQLHDGIILIEDGAFGAIEKSPLSPQLREAMKTGIKIYVLAADLDARGLGHKLVANIFTIDFSGFVQLTLDHKCVQSWY